MTSSKKASNGTSQGRRSKSTSAPPIQPPTSDAVAPSSDSIALPGPSNKKLFPLFDSKSRKTNNGKASSLTGVNSDDLSEGSQAGTVSKGKKKAAAANGIAKAKVASNGSSAGVSGSQRSDASSSTKENTAINTKAQNGKASTKTKKTSKKGTSRSPLIDEDDDVHYHDLDDTTASTVASTSTFSSTPPPQPHKTVITITDSPVRELKPIKTFADLNAERQAKKVAKEAGGWNGGRSPLWPTKENMHVLPFGQPSSHTRRVESPKRDWKGKGRAVDADYLLSDEEQSRYFENIAQFGIADVLHRYTSFESTSQAASSSSTSDGSKKPAFILDEATLKRLKAVSEDDCAESAQQTWYQRYAPMKAADVLGDKNKENAFYLRDWLRELTLQDPMKILNNTRKRKVKREITSDERKRLRRAAKRRKRKGYDGTGFENDEDTLDDFIAADDEIEYDHYDYYNLSDVDGSSLPSSPTKSTTSTSSHQAPFGRFEPLTNVILLTGPVGSGKTSTVYAVANELNWQVFEVYPGIGKRGYKDLERYVGMVGENHIMKRETINPPVSSFFGKVAASTSTSKSTSSSSKESHHTNGIFKAKDFIDPTATSNTGSISSSNQSNGTKPNDDNNNSVKQSCILIEEVDILYESDSSFWEGLISFISKSKRPIILTCNDYNHSIPKDLIPFQNILFFESASGEVGRALLCEIARLEEGERRIRDEISQNAEGEENKRKTVSDEEIEEIIKMASDSAGQVDLRLAINQLQYISSCPSTSSTLLNPPQQSTRQTNHSLRTLQTVLDNASFADAELSRRDWLVLQDDESVAQPDKEDDEFLHHPDLPIHKLDTPIERDPSQPLACYGREEEFCSVCGVIEEDDVEELEILVDEQWHQCTKVQPAVDDLLDESTVLKPSDAKIHLDYLPMLREVVLNDDINEIAYNVALEISAEDIILDSRIRRSRRLAGTGKEGYRRYLDTPREVVECLKGSGLRLKQVEDAGGEGEEEDR